LRSKFELKQAAKEKAEKEAEEEKRRKEEGDILNTSSILVCPFFNKILIKNLTTLLSIMLLDV
jgi:hypothetical protein